MVRMSDQLSGRVMFFVARSHDDLSWYLSIHPEILQQAANGRFPRDFRRSGRGKNDTRLSVVKT
jgi:hypothetical protein